MTSTEIKLAVLGVIILIFLGLGFGTYYYKNEAEKAETKLTECQSSNQINLTTIDSLKEEIKQAVAAADKRLQSKTQLMTKIQYIDGLSSGSANTAVSEQKEGNADAKIKNMDSDNSDPLFVELNRMFTQTNSR